MRTKRTHKLGVKSKASVEFKTGASIEKMIDGVIVRDAVTQVDDRGTLTEIWDARWGLVPEAATYFYKVTVHVGKIKGWSIHKTQYDRLFYFKGTAKLVLYDKRKGSPTRGLINEIYAGEARPRFIVIPPLVYHAVQNVGHNEICFLNFPTVPYNHNDPDRYRLPPSNKKIPYDFSKVNIGK